MLLVETFAKFRNFVDEDLLHGRLAEAEISQIPEDETAEVFPIVADGKNDPRRAAFVLRTEELPAPPGLVERLERRPGRQAVLLEQLPDQVEVGDDDGRRLAEVKAEHRTVLGHVFFESGQ